jgi:hypothetical protein
MGCTSYILVSRVIKVNNKSYILAILNIYHVHPYYGSKLGDQSMSAEAYTSNSATIGGSFVGGLLLGYALKKVLKLIAVVIGLFIAGLACLEHQQIALLRLGQGRKSGHSNIWKCH